MEVLGHCNPMAEDARLHCEHWSNNSGGGYWSNWKTDETRWKKQGWYTREEQEHIWTDKEVEEEHRRDREERNKPMEEYLRTDDGKGMSSKSANEENEK